MTAARSGSRGRAGQGLVPASTNVADARSVSRVAVDSSAARCVWMAPATCAPAVDTLRSASLIVSAVWAESWCRLVPSPLSAASLIRSCCSNSVARGVVSNSRRRSVDGSTGDWTPAGAEVQRHAGVDGRAVLRVDDVGERHVEQLRDQLGAAVLLLRPVDLAAGTKLGQCAWVGGADDAPTVS